MAETDEYVAFGSEYRALAGLPGIDKAQGLGARAGDRLLLGAVSRHAGHQHATIDLVTTPLRELNRSSAPADGRHQRRRSGKFSIRAAQHAVAVGVDAPISVDVKGRVGYYCGGMNKKATITVHGSAGPGVAENMMSGKVVVKGDASQYAGATGRGGLLVIEGNASSRCGISMKGIDIVVKGNIGHMSAFMAQIGHLVVLGDAGDALGDSHLRSEAVRARQREEPRRRLHRKGDAARASRRAGRAARQGRASRTSRRASSSATARPASSTTSTSTTRTPTDDAITTRPPRRASPPTFDDYTLSEIRRAATTGIYDIRGGGAKRKVPHFDDLLFLGASMSRYPLEGYREKCSTTVTLGTRFAKKPIELKIPITIAGMSFGALSAQRQGSAWAAARRSPARRRRRATAA